MVSSPGSMVNVVVTPATGRDEDHKAALLLSIQGLQDRPKDLLRSIARILQCEAPKIAKLVYKWLNNGL